MKQLFSFLITLLFTTPLLVNAQKLSGTITSSDGPIIGASVSAGPGVGTTTDQEGKYSLNLSAGSYVITVKYIGYVSQSSNVTLAANETKTWDVVLVQDALMFGDVVIVGTRTAPRSSISTPVPVDVLLSKDLQETGQTTFDKALQYRVPSFNTVQTPVNDATSLLDPYEIRNMGPSRTLILVNGKRKNSSALIYTQTSPGRGETGADISAIPADAVKRVEILRDGASAQYGSDAIAGVMNIILKDNTDQGSATLRTGITAEGDGEMFGLSVNNGAKVTEKGFINYTVDVSKIGLANRPGTVDAKGEAGDFGANVKDVEAFLQKKPDAGNINGSPETTASKFLVNGDFGLDENTELYYNAAYIYKQVNSFANYRTPYWRTLADYPYLKDFFPGEDGIYMGYVPTFDGLLNDYNGTFGFRKTQNGWNTDVSFTTGGNSQFYTVRNSHNRNTAGVRNPDVYLGDLNSNGVVDADEMVLGSLKYLENSPITFRAGGTRFSHNVGNIDISKEVSEKISIGFGTEFRSETFDIVAGDLASYEAGGADSYAGNSAENSFKSNRYNLGGYFDLAYDITEDFLINGTARIENYSDFGSAKVWKLSSRYKFADDKVTLRASYSTGFRAPSLHQIYTQKAQYSFVPGQGIQVSGLVNNVSPQAKVLGIPHLNPEESTNLSIGLGTRPNKNFSLTLDYYNIQVTDRIVLSNNIGPSGDTTGTVALDKILAANNIVSLSFFTNALDSRTSGIDAVANYKNIALGAGSLGFSLAGNYTLKNERVGDVKNPKVIVDANKADNKPENDQTIVNFTQEALMFTSRPKFKAIFGINYDIKKFSFNLGNTVFGPTKFRNDGMNKNLQIEFKTKLVTDLGVSFQASEKVAIAFNINNLLNVLPEWEMVALNPDGEKLLSDTKIDPAYNLTQKEIQMNLVTFNQRYSIMTYDGYHFSQLGTILNLSVNVKL